MLERASFDFDMLATFFGNDKVSGKVSDRNVSIQLAIFRELSFEDVVALMTLNTYFYQALKDQDYWRDQIDRYFCFNIDIIRSPESAPYSILSRAPYREKYHLTPNASYFDYFKALTGLMNERMGNNRFHDGAALYNNQDNFLKLANALHLSYYEVAMLPTRMVSAIPEQAREYLFSVICRYFRQSRGLDYTKKCEYNGNTLIQCAIKFNRVEFIKNIPADLFALLAPQYPSIIDSLEFSGSPQMLTLMKEKGLPLDTANTRGGTLLHAVIQQRKNLWITLLCELGVNPNVRNQFGETPLHVAAKNGNNEALSLLIESGADPLLKKTETMHQDNHSIRLSEGSTLLHCAVRGKNIDTLKSVIYIIRSTETVDFSLAMNALDVNGYSPLDLAVQDGSEAVFDALLDEEGVASITDTMNVDGNSMLHLAICSGNSNIVNRMLNLGGFNCNYKNAKGETLLHFVVRYFKGPDAAFMVNLLCRGGVDLEAKTNNSADIPGATPLHYAVTYGNLNAAKQLLREFVDINAVTADGRTAIYLLVQPRSYMDEKFFNAMSKMLMKRNPDLNLGKYNYTGEDEKLIPCNGDTLVHAAMRSGGFVFDSVMKWPGINIDAQNANGDTPLHVAARCSDSRYVFALLDNFANLNIVNKNHETPFVVCVKKNKLQFADFFFGKNAGLEKGSLPEITSIILGEYYERDNKYSITDASLVRLFEAMPNLETIELEGTVNITRFSHAVFLKKDSFASLKTVVISGLDLSCYEALNLILRSSPNVSLVVCEGITPEGVEGLFDIYEALATDKDIQHDYSRLMVDRYVTTSHGFFAATPGEKRLGQGLDSPSKRNRL